MMAYKAFFGGLICDSDDSTSNILKISIGRVLLWLVFVMTCLYWLGALGAGGEAPSSLVTVFIAMLGYNLGKKVTNSWEHVKGISGQVLPEKIEQKIESIIDPSVERNKQLAGIPSEEDLENK